jgi:hypothetical protein
MIRPETATLLEDLNKRETPPAAWPVVERLLAVGDPELLSEVRRRTEAGDFDTAGRAVVSLLSRLRGPDAEAALRALLPSRDLDTVADALRALAPYLSPTDGPMLSSFLEHADHSVRLAAIVASGHSKNRGLASAVAARLSAQSEEERMQAAIALGHLGEPAQSSSLAARLGKERGRTFTAFAAALEMLRAPDVVPTLVDVLRTAPREQVWDLTHALWSVSGVDVAVDARAEPEQVRRAWLKAAAGGDLTSAPAARVSKSRRDAAGLVTFDVLYGHGRIRIDFDKPAPGATWPRWNRSLFVGDRKVIEVGSTCGTCESLLRFVDWPGQEISALAQSLEDRSGRRDLPETVAAWTPLLCELRSGNYFAAELSFPIERIDSNRRHDSWFNRRRELRIDEDEPDASPAMDEADDACPAMTHYQGPRASEPPLYPVVLPLADPVALVRPTVDEYVRRIAEGDRPPVVAFAWIDDREVQSVWHERFLFLAVLNGHHRLEAYARAGVPARLLAFARIDDSWGPPEDPGRYLRESFAAWSR